MKTKTIKIAGASFEEVTRALGNALQATYPSEDGSPCCYPYPTECYDDRVIFTGPDGVVVEQSYTYAAGVATLTGSPTPVVRQYVPAASAGQQPAPAAPVTQQAKRGAAPMKTKITKAGGADIVQLAADRLSALAKSMKKGDGTITPEIKSELDAVSSLLETASSLYSGSGGAADDAEDAADGGADEAAEGDASTMADLASAEKNGGVVKMTPPQFLVYAVSEMNKIRDEKDPMAKAIRRVSLEKAIQYAIAWSQSFSGDTSPAFPVSMAGTQDGPLLPTEQKVTPGALPPAGNLGPAAAGGATGIGGVKGPQDGDIRGTATFTEKIAEVQSAIALLTGSSVAKKATPEPVAKGVPGSTETGLWPAAYVNALPDSSFLHVEDSARKNDAGQTLPAYRHFPVYDEAGRLSKNQLAAAIDAIPRFGGTKEFKAALLAKAQKLFGMSQSIEKSLEDASARGDHGWPVDLASDDYLHGRRPIKAAATFGLDNLKDKAAALEAAAHGAK